MCLKTQYIPTFKMLRQIHLSTFGFFRFFIHALLFTLSFVTLLCNRSPEFVLQCPHLLSFLSITEASTLSLLIFMHHSAYAAFVPLCSFAAVTFRISKQVRLELPHIRFLVPLSRYTSLCIGNRQQSNGQIESRDTFAGHVLQHTR